jgi:hypothetical protein
MLEDRSMIYTCFLFVYSGHDSGRLFHCMSWSVNSKR